MFSILEYTQSNSTTRRTFSTARHYLSYLNGLKEKKSRVFSFPSSSFDMVDRMRSVPRADCLPHPLVLAVEVWSMLCPHGSGPDWWSYCVLESTLACFKQTFPRQKECVSISKRPSHNKLQQRHLTSFPTPHFPFHQLTTMYADISKPPAPLPEPHLTIVQPGISLLLPLSRRGHGPGLILLVPDANAELTITDGVPSHLIKWAEEGYTVIAIQASTLKLESTIAAEILKRSVEALTSCDHCDAKANIGLVGKQALLQNKFPHSASNQHWSFNTLAYDQILFNIVSSAFSNIPEIVAAVVYANSIDRTALSKTNTPVLRHFAGVKDVSEKELKVTEYYYPNVKNLLFATPFQQHFHYTTEAVSHTRNLTFLKKLMDGPFFDLESIWDEHTYYEFADRSVEHTMSTMVQEPYVNHVPTVSNSSPSLQSVIAHHCVVDWRHWSLKTIGFLPQKLHLQ